MKIEKEGRLHRELSTANTGRDVPAYNHYFIFTKPEEFIHRNFPDDEKWQLLSQSITKEEFMAKSYLRPTFFQNGFKLLSDDKCVLTSDTGDPINISIGFQHDDNADLVFAYELSLKIEKEISEEQQNHIEDETTDKEPADHTNECEEDRGRRYVCVRREDAKVTFEIRFHQVGVFKLRLFGGKYSDYGNKPPWILDVRLNCKKVLPQVDPLPFDPGVLGWGPGPTTSELGLFVPSHIDSVVHVTVESVEVISFVVRQPIDALVVLEHVDKNMETLCDFVTIDISAEQGFYVLKTELRYPGFGEYALRIDVRERNRLYNACNYIVHTRIDKPFEVQLLKVCLQYKLRLILYSAYREYNLYCTLHKNTTNVRYMCLFSKC